MVGIWRRESREKFDSLYHLECKNLFVLIITTSRLEPFLNIFMEIVHYFTDIVTGTFFQTKFIFCVVNSSKGFLNNITNIINPTSDIRCSELKLLAIHCLLPIYWYFDEVKFQYLKHPEIYHQYLSFIRSVFVAINLTRSLYLT